MPIFRSSHPSVALILTFAVLAGAGLLSAGEENISSAGSARTSGTRAYSLEDVILMALGRNLEIQVERRAPEIREERIKGALGEFNPVFNLSAIYESKERRQNIREFFATDGISIFEEENALVESSLVGKLPLGTTYEFSLNADRYDNTLQLREQAEFSPEYESDAELTLTQPLLRDFGTDVNLTQVRIARSELKISRYELQEKVLAIIADVMTAYIETIFAQENIRVKQDAIELAEELRAENERRVEAGVMKPIDVVQAEATISEAEEDLITAETFLIDRQNTLKLLIFEDFHEVSDLTVMAADDLDPDVPDLSDERRWLARALLNNPGILKQRETADQEVLRFNYAKNQTLPRLDLRGSIGYNGLDGDVGGSFQDFTRRRGPEWSGGIVFSYPLGNDAAEAQLAEARLRLEQAGLTTRYTESSVAAALDTSIERVRASERRVETTAKSVELGSRALEEEQRRLETGVTTSYNVLQLQEELSAARTRRLGAIAELEKSIINLRRVVGYIPEADRLVDITYPDAGIAK